MRPHPDGSKQEKLILERTVELLEQLCKVYTEYSAVLSATRDSIAAGRTERYDEQAAAERSLMARLEQQERVVAANRAAFLESWPDGHPRVTHLEELARRLADQGRDETVRNRQLIAQRMDRIKEDLAALRRSFQDRSSFGTDPDPGMVDIKR